MIHHLFRTCFTDHQP